MLRSAGTVALTLSRDGTLTIDYREIDWITGGVLGASVSKHSA